MNKLKKYVSLLLVLIMTFSLFTAMPVTFSAEDNETVEATVKTWIEGEKVEDNYYRFKDVYNNFKIIKADPFPYSFHLTFDSGIWGVSKDLILEPGKNKMHLQYSAAEYGNHYYEVEWDIDESRQNDGYIYLSNPGYNADEPLWYIYTWETFTLTKHEAVEPNCTDTAGNIEYYTSGNRYFLKDKDGEFYQVAPDRVIAHPGHKWDMENPTWTWSFDNTLPFNQAANCDFHFTCLRCGAESDKSLTPVDIAYFNPADGLSLAYHATCVKDGRQTYMATARADKKRFGLEEDRFYQNDRSFVYPAGGAIPPTGQHAWMLNDDEINVRLSEDKSHVIVSVECSRCHAVRTFDNGTVTSGPNRIEDATCGNPQIDEYGYNINIVLDGGEEHTLTGVIRDKINIPTPHIFDPASARWNWNGPSSAEMYVYCKNCNEMVVCPATITSDNYSEPGNTVCTASAVYEGVTYTDTNSFALSEPAIAGNSLSLNGDIGVNFYLNLPDEYTDSYDVTYGWDIDGRHKTATGTLLPDVSGLYKVTCNVPAAEMNCTVTASVEIEGKTYSYDYSVVEYARKILSEEYRTQYLSTHTYDQYTTLEALVRAMLDYGSKAQIAFDRDTAHLANGGTDYKSYTADAYEDIIQLISDSASDMNEGLENYGLKYKGSTIVYLTETSLRHYYEIIDNETFNAVADSITFEGEPVGYTVKDGEIYFEKKNIPAANLGSYNVLMIGRNRYDYSVLDYVRRCLLSGTTKAETKALAAATYYYWQAAKNYDFGN